MRDTCRVRSARVIRAKFLAMHFPRTCRPTDVDVALSPLLGRCSALVYYYYHYYYCYYRDGVALSLSLSRSLSLFNLYTSCGGWGGGASRFGNDCTYYGGGAEVTRRRNNKGPLSRTPGNVLCSVRGARGAKTSTCVQEGGWRGACALVRVAIP